MTARTKASVAWPLHEQPLVSIIVPVYNQADFTARCLAAIAAHSTRDSYEVIVVNDASNDTTATMVAGIQNLRVATNATNLGYLRSCNIGAALAKGRYIVLLNNDTEVEPGWLDALVDCAEADPDVGVVGAKLIFHDGTLQEAGGIIWADGTGLNYGRNGNPDRPEFNFVREVDYCSGACLLVRADLWHRLGGYDERFAPAYYEDTDLCFAARAAGYRVLYQPRARMIHHEGVSHGTDVSSGIKIYQEVNRVKFYDKWAAELTRQAVGGSAVVRRACDRRQGPSVLVMDGLVPTADSDADSPRMSLLLRALVEFGCRVRFLPQDLSRREPYSSRLGQLGIEVLSAPGDVREVLNSLTGDVDFTIISRPEVAAHALPLVREYLPGSKVIYDIGDFQGLRAGQGCETGTAAGLPGAANSSRALTLALIRSADASIAVTEHERDLVLAEAPGARVHVVPTIHASLGTRSGFAERTGLLFVGSYLDASNEDAVLYFHSTILPLIRRHLPEVVLHLVGDPVFPNIEALESPLVRVHGRVEDLSPLYDRCRVFVAPLRFGAGMKGTVGESMVHGVPVVTTSVGAAGLHLTDGADALVADNSLAFAEAVVRLHTDAALWQTLVDGSTRQIAARYVPAAVAHHLAALLEGHGPAGPVSDGIPLQPLMSAPSERGPQTASREATLAAIINSREKHIATMAAALNDREKHIATMAAALNDREKHIATMAAALKDRENRIDHLAAVTGRLESLLSAEVENSRLQRQPFTQPSSWRLPAPLRTADRFVRRAAPLMNLRVMFQLMPLLAIRRNRQFDVNYYRGRNRDLGAFGRFPFLHWLLWGAAEGRKPNSWFDTAWYCKKYPDVAASKLNPLVHYLRYGIKEGRQPNSAGILSAALVQGRVHTTFSPEPRRSADASAIPAEVAPSPARSTKPANSESPCALVIDSRWPQPDRDAGSVEALNLVTSLLTLGYRVAFAACVKDKEGDRYRPQLERLGVLCLPPSGGKAVEDYLREEGKDLKLCVLYRVHSGGAFFEMVRRHAGGARIVFNTVDLHGVREQREAVHKEDALGKSLAAATIERELYLVRQADATVVVSLEERDLLAREVQGALVSVLPLAREVSTSVAGYDVRSGIGFIGGFAHMPNVDAVEFFVKHVWPLVRRELPECEFTIVGADLPDGLLKDAPAGVRYLGQLPDIAPWFSGLRVSVAPLRFGAGVKGKVASSLASGVPCVVTPIGAEGMGLCDGLNILIGETPEALAAKIVEVYTDKTTWQRLSAAGLEFARRELSLKDWQVRLASLLETIGLPPAATANRPASNGETSRP